MCHPTWHWLSLDWFWAEVRISKNQTCMHMWILIYRYIYNTAGQHSYNDVNTAPTSPWHSKVTIHTWYAHHLTHTPVTPWADLLTKTFEIWALFAHIFPIFKSTSSKENAMITILLSSYWCIPVITNDIFLIQVQCILFGFFHPTAFCTMFYFIPMLEGRGYLLLNF